MSDGEEASVSTRAVRGLLFHVAAHGVDPVALAKEHGVGADVLYASEGRISHAKLVALWETAAARLGDPDLGLHVVDSADVRLLDLRAQPSDYLVLQLLVTSRDLGEGLERFARYFPIANGHANVALLRSGRHADLVLSLADGAARSRQYIEYILGTIAKLVRFTTGEAVQPHAFFLRHAAPDSTVTHARVLGPRVSFGAAFDGFRLTTDELAVKLATSEPALLRTIERRAEHLLKVNDGEDALVRQLHAWFADELRKGAPSAERAAEKFGVSVRTMSRRLHACGTSHQKLLDAVRRDLAERYLLDECFNIADVASLLGFAEASTFDRAFRRWFGVSPGQYRASESKPAAG